MPTPPSRIIHCWSGPRCCSTALMYSFAQRADTKVLDEPLYASYLERTGIVHPGNDEILATYDTDGDSVLTNEIYGADGSSKPVLYVKHIGKFKLTVSNGTFDRDTHVILVRDPAAVLRSWAKVQEPTMQELGYTALLEIVSELRSRGRPIIVVQSDELVRDPEPTLRALCAAIDLSFDPAMLSWSPGPKPYDGCWGKYWYENTWKSTGFSGSVRESLSPAPLPLPLRPLYQEAATLYSLLRPLALKPLQTREAASSPLDGLAAMAGQSGTQQASSRTPTSTQADDDTSQQQQQGPLLVATGTHSHTVDPRNADLLVGIRDGVTGSFDLVWRPCAKVSVLDSGFMLGDGMWEGIRLHRGVLVKITEHLDRLWEGCKAIDMHIGLTRTELQELIYRTVDANGMATATGVHIRLMVTRGLKPTPYQSPYITIGKPTIVILAEYKEAILPAPGHGLSLFTVHVRRGHPDVQDPGWNSHSKLNCIAACIQAKKAGADEALMLDPHGFVCTCNSTHFFIVRKGEVWTATPKYLMPGITRASMLKLCATHGIPYRETNYSLTQVYSADEAFVTGTFAGLCPVRVVDGRPIGEPGVAGPVTTRLQELYKASVDTECEAGRKAKP